MNFNTKSLISARAHAIALLAGLCLTAPKAHAYYSTLDSGEMLDENQYQAMVSLQSIFNKYDGMNFTGRLDTGIREDISIRGVLGFGKVDFHIGALAKWMPFPDTDQQPAIGAEAGVLLARIGSVTQYSLRVHPLISKKLELEIGDVIPYASLPTGVTIQTGSGADETFTPLQLVIGSELRPLELKDWSFFAELGLNLHKSFGYIAASAAYRFSADNY